MAEHRKCAFPGCDRDARPRKFFCSGHVPRKPSPGADMYCQMPGCGYGPLRSLAAHINTFHDGTAEYKKRFGWDSVVSADMRRNFRAQWDDRVEDGLTTNSINPRRKRTCRRGHALVGNNVYFVRRGGTGPYQERTYRRCRKCRRERYAKTRKIAPWRKRPRKCHWCHQPYLPNGRGQRYCSVEHAREAALVRGRLYMRARRTAAKLSAR